MKVEQKIMELGLRLPQTIQPQGTYTPGVRVGDCIYTSGQTCRVDGKLQYVGKVGAEVSEEDAYQAARICAMNCLAIVRQVAGDLDHVEQIVRMTGFVASDPQFTQQTKVIDAASKLLKEIFGERGLAARSAIGVCALPGDAPCEIELIVKVKD